MHASWFDGADRYCKDTYLIIKYLGTSFMPRLIHQGCDGSLAGEDTGAAKPAS